MKVPISGQVTGAEEAYNVAQVALSDHYGGGEWVTRFEKKFAGRNGARFGMMTNSGSSANLLALAALELPKGSEVMTCAVNFPTTVNAIIQLGLKPVFVDADPKTLNAVPFEVEESTKAVILAHTLGNPAPSPDFYPLIEDCCDALGSTVNGELVGRKGTFATFSFYPAHHITTGEGGMVLTDIPKYKKIVESYRDWGRDCWCEPGKDNTCGTRFETERDHKYSYSRIGYNLKSSDLNAAVGVAQMDRLDGFIQKRRENWRYLYEGLKDLPIEIIEPSPNSNPSWFGFAFLTKDRRKLAPYLDSNGVGCRPAMGGNLLNQDVYKNLVRGVDYRVIGSLDGSDRIDREALWIGVYSGITSDMRDYQIDIVRKFYGK